MNLLDKFTDIKVDNSKRLPAEDIEHCKIEEEMFLNAYNAYSTAYNSVKNAFDRQNEFDGGTYSGFIWKYCDCGVNDLRDKLISLKSSFISKIVGYFNRKYHLNLSSNNKFDGTTYHKDLSLDVITIEEVLDEYIFGRLEGLTFTECAIKQAMEKNDIKRQEWNKWCEKWNYSVKGRAIKFQYPITDQKPLLYFYDNNETEVCSTLKHNKIDSIQEFKNGSVSVKFLSAEFALEFAKKYLGYIEMTDEEIEKLKAGN